MNSAIRQFRDDGFTVFGGFLSFGEVEAVHRQIGEYVDRIVPTLPKEEVFYENKENPATLKQLSRINQRQEFFQRMFVSEKLVETVRSLLGVDVKPHAMQWLNKPPGSGAETPPHQDGFYFRITPNEAVTFWLALDPVNEQNGCIRYVPGSHRRGVVRHERSRTLGFSQTVADYGIADQSSEVAICAQPGDLIAHHSLTIHRADPNTSHHPRRALTAVYFSARARTDDEGLKRYREQLNTELVLMERI